MRKRKLAKSTSWYVLKICPGKLRNIKKPLNTIVVDDSRTGFLVFIDYGTTKEREYIYE